jgi:hypothetical protein
MSLSITSSLPAGALVLALVTGCASSAPRVDASGTLARARAVCPGGSVRGDQELAGWAGCRRIEGDLVMSGVSSLSPLASLEAVGGTLAVRASSAESLDGLERLRSVGGLALEENQKLDDISALESLDTAKRLSFVGNPRLSSPNGLSGLSELEQLVVRESAFLSLHGLEGLTRIDSVQIRNNPNLISLRALNEVRFAREVVLEGNPIVCGSFGVLTGLSVAPLQLVARSNSSLRSAELRHLRAPEAARDGIALR